MADEANVESIRVSMLEQRNLVRDGLKRVLSGAGIEVVADYADPQRFLEAMPTDRPAVAIVDLPLREEDGLKVIAWAQDAHPSVAVLAIADSSQSELVERCLRAGAAGYVDKVSAGGEVLIDAVRTVARGLRVVPFASFDLHPPPESTPEEPQLLRSLSAREREVLAWIGCGADNLKIAALLGITERTVKAHVSSLYRKLGQENRTQMALLAQQLGVKPPARAG